MASFFPIEKHEDPAGDGNTTIVDGCIDYWIIEKHEDPAGDGNFVLICDVNQSSKLRNTKTPQGTEMLETIKFGLTRTN